MNGVILYKSKYGSTKKYADWLSKSTGFNTVDIKKADIEEIKKYETIIIGGGIYAMGIAGLSFLKKNISYLNNKKIIVFCVGASPFDDEAFKAVKERNMKNELLGIPLFYCRGAWDLDGMKFIDKKLCTMLRKSVAKKSPEECEIWEKALIAAGDGKSDWTDKKYIEPILKALA